ncbi:unnamed protein product, partial [Mesorhabditis belari]|uniref:Uncharacterized protein n=1 Tax=Mesorhabditis belari TaxID=2138241 RepID=A0AAF3F001_9BILA
MDITGGILAKILTEMIKFNGEMKKMREDIQQMNGSTQKLNTSIEGMLKNQAEMYQLFEMLPLLLCGQQRLLEAHGIISATAKILEVGELPKIETPAIDISNLFGLIANQPTCSKFDPSTTSNDDEKESKRRIRPTTPEDIRQKARESELRWNEKKLEEVTTETEIKRLKRTLYNRERISKETAEERELRLEKKRYARKMSLLTETPEDRQLRLHKKRVAKRRKTQRDGSSQSGSVNDLDLEQRINLEMLCNGS